MNLLDVPWIKAAAKSQLYPVVFQWITTAVFVLLLLLTLFGPNNAGQNFGMALTWSVWWPLLPLSFLLLGRFWCAICPFAWVTDWVQKAVGIRLSVPFFLRQFGPWMIAGIFILVTYLDEAWGFNSDARKTGYLLLTVLAAVIFFGAFFERRTFCRYLCFIGGFAANYSRAGMIELRAVADRCQECSTQDCYRGTTHNPGCPVFLFAPNVEDSGTCELCGNCVKNCPHDAIRVSVRKPAAELCGIRQPYLLDSLLAATVVGVVLIEQYSLLGWWNRLVVATGAVLHVDPYVSSRFVYGALLSTFIAVPLFGLLLASFGLQALSGRISLAELKQNVSFSGYAVIPLALASHLAQGVGRLLTWSRTVPFALAATVHWFPGNNHPAWVSRHTVSLIEVVVLALGAAVSLYVGLKLTKRQAHHMLWTAYTPLCLLVLFLLAANLYAVVTMMHQFY